MTKMELTAAVKAAKIETKDALQTVYDALNQGQKNKLLKEDHIVKIFELYELQI